MMELLFEGLKMPKGCLKRRFALKSRSMHLLSRVWQLLTDFSTFPDWNPFISRADGEARNGARLEVYVQPSGAKGMTFRPTVLKADPNRELRWLGRLWIPGLFDGEHVFTIEPLEANRVRFIQHEVFTGLLVPLFARFLAVNTQRGFVGTDNVLKVRAWRKISAIEIC